MFWEIPLISRIKSKHVKIFIFSIISVLLISLLDILSMKSGIFGNVLEYTNGIFGCDWWSLFFKIGAIMITIPAAIYYFFVRKDLSESISFIVSSFILWFTGTADVGYFLLTGSAIPTSLPWLDGSLIIGWVSLNIFKSSVTNFTLLITAFFGLIISYFVTKLLVKKF